MERQWLAYLVVALLSIGAGVAIAGPANNAPTPRRSSLPPRPSLPGDVGRRHEHRAGPRRECGNNRVRASTDTTTTPAQPASSATSTTTTTTTSTLPTDDLPPRSEVFTIVANGANIAGAAGRNVEQLRALGYTDVAPRSGTTVFDFTTVYFADGLDAAASRLADDLELSPDLIAPLDEAPNVLDLPDGVELVAYIGLDRLG